MRKFLHITLFLATFGFLLSLTPPVNQFLSAQFLDPRSVNPPTCTITIPPTTIPPTTIEVPPSRTLEVSGFSTVGVTPPSFFSSQLTHSVGCKITPQVDFQFSSGIVSNTTFKNTIDVSPPLAGTSSLKTLECLIQTRVVGTTGPLEGRCFTQITLAGPPAPPPSNPSSVILKPPVPVVEGVQLIAKLTGSSKPIDVAVDPLGTVFVLDEGNEEIHVFAQDLTFNTKFSVRTQARCINRQTLTPGQVRPATVAVDSSRNVYVATRLENRIVKMNNTGQLICLTEWDKRDTGEPGPVNDITVFEDNVSGNVYVAEGGAGIFVYDLNGIRKNVTFRNGNVNVQFNNAVGVAVDALGNIYVTDQGNKRVQKFKPTGELITQWGTEGPKERQFLKPTGIALDPAGNVYVTDSVADRVQKFSGDGTFLTQFGFSGSGDGQFNAPTGITVDSTNRVYVADTGNNRIQVFVVCGNNIIEGTESCDGTALPVGQTCVSKGFASGELKCASTCLFDTSSCVAALPPPPPAAPAAPVAPVVVAPIVAPVPAPAPIAPAAPIVAPIVPPVPPAAPITVPTMTCIPVQQFEKTRTQLECRLRAGEIPYFLVAEVTFPFKARRLIKVSSSFSATIGSVYPAKLVENTMVVAAIDWGNAVVKPRLQSIPFDGLSILLETDQSMSAVKKAFAEKKTSISLLSPNPANPIAPFFQTLSVDHFLAFDGTLILESFTQYVSSVGILQFLRIGLACFEQTPQTCLTNIIQNL